MKPDRKFLMGGLLLLAGIASVVIIYQSTSKPDLGPGGRIYLEQCSSCHGREGAGLRELYPPLAGSPYLSETTAETACLIRRGVRGLLVTADGSYNQRMPAFPHLTAADISQLIAFMQNRWGKKKTITPVETLEQWLLSCP